MTANFNLILLEYCSKLKFYYQGFKSEAWNTLNKSSEEIQGLFVVIAWIIFAIIVFFYFSSFLDFYYESPLRIK